MDAELKESNYSLFSPKCCNEHKIACSKRHHIDTSDWKFEDELTRRRRDKKFDPWHREMPSTQQKLKVIKEIDERLEYETRQALLDEIKEVTPKTGTESTSEERFKSESIHTEPIKDEDSEELRGLKESKKGTNRYLILLNRLDEEEGVKTPSIEDKLKLAEDRLRISTTQFCKACEELIDEKADEPDSVEKFPFLNSQKVHDAFRPKIFDPSLRPPQTLTVSEVDKKPMVGTTEESQQKV
ncbi:uncharacterized protein CDAR_537381 [Caerostris darwini]|uniref:Uncharacterized protein n=1 Tax=Caerostris darwini TaxID=1538125 RepID=A0AAV4MZ91_9ARAC|nr:uncharacterized protein CDAR_537381 [Caerostris darwini]